MQIFYILKSYLEFLLLKNLIKYDDNIQNSISVWACTCTNTFINHIL